MTCKLVLPGWTHCGLVPEIIKRLRGNGTKVAVTASTGIAGVNVGGGTVHSFAGVHFPTSDLPLLTTTYTKALVSERKKLKLSHKK